MKHLTFPLLLTSLLTLVPALAQVADEGIDTVDTTGILSYIEDLPDPANDEGLARKLPFVEVIEEDRLAECQEVGFDSPACQVFEWSSPFFPEDMATGAEAAIVDAWFRYETRVHMRTALEIGAFHPLLACSLGGIDLFTLVREGTLFVAPDEFCDDKPLSVFNECFLECDFNLLQSQCPEAKPGCGDCIKEHLKLAQEHYPVYYQDYVQTVLTEVVTPLQAAGALNWRESLLPGSGALVTPIVSLNPETVTGVVTDFNTRIIPDAVATDPRAAVYYSQAGLLNDPCRVSFPGLGLGSPGLPGAFDPTAPGLAALEMFKREMADRESAGDTWKRTINLLLTWNKDELYPRYSKPTGYFSNLFGGEPSKKGVMTPLQHACLGEATFFMVYEKLADVTVLAHRPIVRPTVCWIDFIPAVTAAPGTPHIITLADTRFHTDWAAVPEGYAIPHVAGVPLPGLGALTPQAFLETELQIP